MDGLISFMENLKVDDDLGGSPSLGKLRMGDFSGHVHGNIRDIHIYIYIWDSTWNIIKDLSSDIWVG